MCFLSDLTVISFSCCSTFAATETSICQLLICPWPSTNRGHWICSVYNPSATLEVYLNCDYTVILILLACSDLLILKHRWETLNVWTVASKYANHSFLMEIGMYSSRILMSPCYLCKVLLLFVWEGNLTTVSNIQAWVWKLSGNSTVKKTQTF